MGILLNEKSSSTSLFEVELITTTNENEEDDILNKKLKNARTINTKTNINNNNIEVDDDDENEKENILIVISLRALDVSFYIVEKFFITGAPVVLRTSNNKKILKVHIYCLYRIIFRCHIELDLFFCACLHTPLLWGACLFFLYSIVENY